MNRGSAWEAGEGEGDEGGFNEAPIHESGKSNGRLHLPRTIALLQ